MFPSSKFHAKQNTLKLKENDKLIIFNLVDQTNTWSDGLQTNISNTCDYVFFFVKRHIYIGVG